jgi:hypothetical protein
LIEALNMANLREKIPLPPPLRGYCSVLAYLVLLNVAE